MRLDECMGELRSLTNQFPCTGRTTPDLSFVLKKPIRINGGNSRLFCLHGTVACFLNVCTASWCQTAARLQICLHSFLMIALLSSWRTAQTPLLTFLYWTWVQHNYSWWEKIANESVMGLQREALCAPNSHVCVCFRKAGTLLRCAFEPQSHGTVMWLCLLTRSML